MRMKHNVKTDSGRSKILMIDDDEEFADDLTYLLDGPYAFHTVTESRKGIELLERERFDLILLDLNMPAFFAENDEREGIEVLEIIRDKWGKELPIIILTRMDDEETRRECEDLLASAFYAKPPEVDALRKKIEELLGGGKDHC